MYDFLAESRFLVLSSHTNPGLSTPIGHQLYCDRHGYDYAIDTNPYAIPSGENYKLFDHKLASILSHLRRIRSEWLLWLDHDAYIMDHSIPLERFVEDAEGVDFIFCNSPVNARGQWTMLNSGVFFVRNTPEARRVLHEALLLDIETARAWWRPETHGLFTTGDQDKIVYVLHDGGEALRPDVRILDHSAFNSRPAHFTERADQRFVCHLAMGGDKLAPIRRLRADFGLDENLMPEGTVYPVSVRASVHFKRNVDGRSSLAVRALRKARRMLRSRAGRRGT